MCIRDRVSTQSTWEYIYKMNPDLSEYPSLEVLQKKYSENSVSYHDIHEKATLQRRKNENFLRLFTELRKIHENFAGQIKTLSDDFLSELQLHDSGNEPLCSNSLLLVNNLLLQSDLHQRFSEDLNQKINGQLELFCTSIEEQTRTIIERMGQLSNVLRRHDDVENEYSWNDFFDNYDSLKEALGYQELARLKFLPPLVHEANVLLLNIYSDSGRTPLRMSLLDTLQPQPKVEERAFSWIEIQSSYSRPSLRQVIKRRPPLGEATKNYISYFIEELLSQNEIDPSHIFLQSESWNMSKAIYFVQELLTQVKTHLQVPTQFSVSLTTRNFRCLGNVSTFIKMILVEEWNEEGILSLHDLYQIESKIKNANGKSLLMLNNSKQFEDNSLISQIFSLVLHHKIIEETKSFRCSWFSSPQANNLIILKSALQKVLKEMKEYLEYNPKGRSILLQLVSSTPHDQKELHSLNEWDQKCRYNEIKENHRLQLFSFAKSVEIISRFATPYLSVEEISVLLLVSKEWYQVLRKDLFAAALLNQTIREERRIEIWKNFYTDNKNVQCNQSERKNENSEQSEEISMIIDRDVESILSQGTMQNSEVLRRLLRAYSFYKPDLGYTHGMDSIMSFLLLKFNGDEENTFRFFCRLMDNLLIGIYSFESNELPSLQAKLEKMLMIHLPLLHNHLQMNDVKLSDIAYGWFSTLFAATTNIQDHDILNVFWDRGLIFGWKGIFEALLITLRVLESSLLSKKGKDLSSSLENILSFDKISQQGTDMMTQIHEQLKHPQRESIVDVEIFDEL
eukprot:TRINITY_DN4364_c0_g1_i2.p1 TRINITY_DN4364_c0_g1~~TRINITY_DN4364_c0_g1_i2.p1  ORF type:complete len:793 (-),score=192.34 TRINITY_DN4364_c0_g1_i2:131-2509(-)